MGARKWRWCVSTAFSSHREHRALRVVSRARIATLERQPAMSHGRAEVASTPAVATTAAAVAAPMAQPRSAVVIDTLGLIY